MNKVKTLLEECLLTVVSTVIVDVGVKLIEDAIFQLLEDDAKEEQTETISLEDLMAMIKQETKEEEE